MQESIEAEREREREREVIRNEVSIKGKQKMAAVRLGRKDQRIGY